MNKLFLFLLTIALYSCQEVEKSDSRVERLPFYNEATFKPNWMLEDDNLLSNFHQISPFRLINQEGETVTNKTFENKIYGL